MGACCRRPIAISRARSAPARSANISITASPAWPSALSRRADIPRLAEHCLHKVAESMGQGLPTLHESARNKLSGYAWPGNVRQLQNVMRRAFLMCRGKHILAADLDFGDAGADSAMPSASALSEADAVAGL